MVQRASATALVFSLAATLYGCAPNALYSAPPVQPIQSSEYSMVLPLTLGTPTHDERPMITLRVGGGPPSRFMLDTGSYGLRVFRGALGPAVHDTGIPIQESASTFGGRATDTRVYRGTIGTGPVEVAGILIPSATFQIVSEVCTGSSCDPNGEPLNVGAGIFGVEVTSGQSPFKSLMSQLPGNLGSGFIISLSGDLGPTMTVGITPENSSGFATYKFQSRVGVQSIVLPRIVDRFPWCYTIPQTSLQHACAPAVVTDTGGEEMVISLPDDPAPRLFPVSGTLGPGVTVVATLGDITWTFQTGSCLHYDRVDVRFRGAPDPGLASNSTNPFFSNDVMYDLRDGVFGFRPANAPPPRFCHI